MLFLFFLAPSFKWDAFHFDLGARTMGEKRTPSEECIIEAEIKTKVPPLRGGNVLVGKKNQSFLALGSEKQWGVLDELV